MPILEVEIVASGETDRLPADLTQSLADVAAQIFNTPQGTTWVKVRVLPSAHYAEDHGRPLGIHPVFVTVLKSHVPDNGALEREISLLTSAIARVLNRSETNIHIVYQTEGAGRVAFGGQLVG
jgi:phenylpyruvate tautomerase PptA (4-oxalocrotonate tautomerase family)